MATVTLENLKKSFGKTEVIQGIDIDIADGEFVVIVGPSGCGKSTLLRMVAGLETATSGEVRIDGKRVNDVEPMDRDIAMVFQNYALYPHMSVFDNMAYGLKIQKVAKPEIAERVSGRNGLPWSGTYPQDPLLSAVALKQLKVVLRDNLAGRAARLGEVMRGDLEGLKERHECIGDVRGKGLYHMLDIVTDRDSRKPDAEMAERIRYNALLEGVVLICVKNYIRLCPPLIITDAELAEIIGRLETAIKRAEEGFPTTTNVSSSSSLATNDHHEFRGHLT
ncbi:aminotransferase class III-fold pyridoxal phosphate-dependent enzyme [Marinovum algicola]|uniref:aminotransferase class III-fold pyridoxal phosphate-dependent enzyme n=1 Tax=Marinovum algicola TaxID=42444 RepID=UPI0024B9A8F5|nr:aminotransferase class III-fold pyridoxal phosphate-dependent enzyme [Marinovum algicola]